jgi:hypothetical protein
MMVGDVDRSTLAQYKVQWREESCADGSKPSGYINGRKFLDKLTNHHHQNRTVVKE